MFFEFEKIETNKMGRGANAMIVECLYAVTQIDILPDGQMVGNFFGASSKKSLWREIKLVWVCFGVFLFFCWFGLIL